MSEEIRTSSPYIFENKEYSAIEVIKLIDTYENNYNFANCSSTLVLPLVFLRPKNHVQTFSEGVGMVGTCMFLCVSIGFVYSIFYPDIFKPLSSYLTTNSTYTGAELANFLNNYSKLSYWSSSYQEDFNKTLNQLLEHQYDKNSVTINGAFSIETTELIHADMPDYSSHLIQELQTEVPGNILDGAI